MTAPPGWYPDPGGAPGRIRFWDGQAWGPDTPQLPATGPPLLAAARRQDLDPARLIPPPRRSRWGWWLAVGALLLAMIVGGVLVVRAIGGGSLLGPANEPGSDPTQQTCPRVDPTETPAAPATGDRVRSGQLSYPRLPAPFGAPIADDRTPFGHDVQSQQALVERSADGVTTWVAWALIARLMAGDGFYGPQQGAGVVADCVVALFYNNHEIHRTDTRREATTVDGHPAYLIESHLTFDIPGIQTKGETMIVLVVDVGQQGEAGLFYGTIPDTSPQFLGPIRQAQADLQIG